MKQLKIISNLKSIFHWFLPPTCVLCRSPSQCARDLCVGCEGDLPSALSGCYHCGQPVGNRLKIPPSAEANAMVASPLPSKKHAGTCFQSGYLKICGACLQKPPAYDRLFALCYYEFPIINLITGLKFHRQLGYAQVLGELLAERLQQEYPSFQPFPDVLIPIPLHPHRLRERGYNQALELARPIAKKLSIPLDIYSCQRTRATVPQMHVSASERDKNVRGAFTVASTFSAKHVALIDDVVTTGHTVTELARVLRKQGVQKIDVICCARTLLSS